MSMTLAEFAFRLAEGALELKIREHEAIEQAAEFLEDKAKAVLGTYDYGWAPLQPRTIARKATGDSPLLETGQMRDSIHHNSTAIPCEAYIGTDSKIAQYQEFGTSRGIPPRSFIEGTLSHHEHEVVEIISHRIALVFEHL